MSALRRITPFLVGFLCTCGFSLGVFWLSGLPFERGSLTAFWSFMTLMVAVFMGVTAHIIVNMWRDENGANHG